MSPLQQLNRDGLALVDGAGLSRRGFVRGTLGTGFAAAVLPVAAQTVVKTTADGLLAGEVSIPVGDFKLPAYRAQPAGAKNCPVLLVASEIFGVHEHIADVARRFAHQGWCAIAPELFVRQGDAGAYGEIAKLMSEVIAKVPDAQVMGDLDACVRWADAQGMAVDRLGITGFCWGGRIVWLYAAHNPALKAGVAWYGRVAGPANALTPHQPLDQAALLKAPVLGLYGAQDAGIPQESLAQMRGALQAGPAAARASEIVVYEHAGHGFNADYRPSYNAEAAQAGWTRCLQWLRAHGAG